MQQPREDHLAAAIAASDPLDGDAQTALLSRIRDLRRAVPKGADADLFANLDMAAMLTQHLIRMGGLGPRDVLQIISRLVGEVELAFRLADPGEDEREGEARAPVPEPAGGLRLVGESAERGGAKLLGEVLVQLGHVRRDQLESALKVQKATGLRIGEALVQTDALTWDQLRQALAAQEQLQRALRG